MALREITEEEVENRLSSRPPAVDMSLHDELLRLQPVRVPPRARIFSDDDDDDGDESTILANDHDYQDFEYASAEYFFGVEDFSHVSADDDDLRNQFLSPQVYDQSLFQNRILHVDELIASLFWDDDISPADHDDFANYLYQQEVDWRTNRTDGLSEEIISQFLKSRTRRCCGGSSGSGEDDDLEETICVVCQCGYEKSEEEEEILVAALECGHEYHESCIHNWLTVKNSCPLCKREAIQRS